MGCVFNKSNGRKIDIGDDVFWKGLKNNGESLKSLLSEVAKEPDSQEKHSMINWIDQISFQDDRAFFYPFRSGHDGATKDYLENPVALKMFKMLRMFFKEQKHKPYFLNRVGVKVVQEHITGRPKLSAADIQKASFKAAAARLNAKEKVPRKLKKEIIKKLKEINR